METTSSVVDSLSTRLPFDEDARVSAHLARAERIARSRDEADLDPLRRLVRALLLDELAAYRAERRFPRNPDFADRTPFFVDASGTRCAVAHLLEVSGEGALVARIASERNNALVEELADEPRLLAWLDAVGLTVEEAAAIQPTYGLVLSSCICGGPFSMRSYSTPAYGSLEVTLAEPVVVGTAMMRVDRVHGDGRGHAVGDVIAVSGFYGPGTPAGTRAIVPLAPPAHGSAADGGAADSGVVASFWPIGVDADGVHVCRVYWTSLAPSVTSAQVVNALLSPDCHGTLVGYDARFAYRMGDPLPPAPDAGAPDAGAPDAGAASGTVQQSGCNASPGAVGAPTTVGVLLAILSVLAARRYERSTRTSGSGLGQAVP